MRVTPPTRLLTRCTTAQGQTKLWALLPKSRKIFPCTCRQRCGRRTQATGVPAGATRNPSARTEVRTETASSLRMVTPVGERAASWVAVHTQLLHTAHCWSGWRARGKRTASLVVQRAVLTDSASCTAPGGRPRKHCTTHNPDHPRTCTLHSHLFPSPPRNSPSVHHAYTGEAGGVESCPPPPTRARSTRTPATPRFQKRPRATKGKVAGGPAPGKRKEAGRTRVGVYAHRERGWAAAASRGGG